MTTIRLADVAVACDARFLVGRPGLPIDEAKTRLRDWLTDMSVELDRKLKAERASQAQQRQLRDAFEVVRGLAPGLLNVVMPSPRDRDQGGGHVRRGQATGGQHGHAPDNRPVSQREWEEQQRQRRQLEQQRGLNNLFGILPGGDQDRRRQQAAEQRANDRPVMVLKDAIYQQVLSACVSLDRVLEVAQVPEKKAAVPWARTSEFLDEAQKLFVAHVLGNGELALNELELLENHLKARYGVEVIRASEDTCQSFTLHANDQPEDDKYETKMPAIAVDGQVVLRGEALGPAKECEGGQASGTR
jgi:hypothetical protein